MCYHHDTYIQLTFQSCKSVHDYPGILRFCRLRGKIGKVVEYHYFCSRVKQLAPDTVNYVHAELFAIHFFRYGASYKIFRELGIFIPSCKLPVRKLKIEVQHGLRWHLHFCTFALPFGNLVGYLCGKNRLTNTTVSEQENKLVLPPKITPQPMDRRFFLPILND